MEVNSVWRMDATTTPGITPALAMPSTISGSYSRATRSASARHNSPKNGQSTSSTPFDAGGWLRRMRSSGLGYPNLRRFARGGNRVSALRRPAAVTRFAGTSNALSPFDFARRSHRPMSFWRRMFGKESRETLQPQRLDYLNEGLALERQGDYEAALTSYRLAFRDNPSDSRILLNMAIAFTKTSQPEEAIRHYKRALELDPSLVGAHYGVAFLLLKRGDVAAGRRAPARVSRPPAQGPRRRALDPPRGDRTAGHREQPRAGDPVKRGSSCCRCSPAAACSGLDEGEGGVVALEVEIPDALDLEVGEQLQLAARALDVDGDDGGAPTSRGAPAAPP